VNSRLIGHGSRPPLQASPLKRGAALVSVPYRHLLFDESVVHTVSTLSASRLRGVARCKMGTMPRALKRSEIEELANSLQSLLTLVESGEMDATAATTYRLEGALRVLDIVLGREVITADDHLL